MEFKTLNFEEMLAQIARDYGSNTEDNDSKVREVQWRAQMYQEDVLILDHAQK